MDSGQVNRGIQSPDDFGTCQLAYDLFVVVACISEHVEQEVPFRAPKTRMFIVCFTPIASRVFGMISTSDPACTAEKLQKNRQPGSSLVTMLL
jgi:hypothetical protein